MGLSVSRLRKSRRRLVSLRKSVFAPGIRGIGIAAQFPEPQNVAVEESDLANELGSFPGVAFRDDDASRPAMFNGKRDPIPRMSDQDVVVETGFQWVVCRIPIVTFEKDGGCFRLRFYQVRQREKGDTFPSHIKLAPGGHTMKIADVFELGQSEKLFPGKR